ncbi:heavy metal-associated domain-containing protein [Flavobacterium branchiarum]|uniref:Heavy-metal-associated domain-containing protein n=1 Tax=Flavobacterium branchiarum TaxID=1114870 RepID=A0ABV5FGB7_9FLAO|nr:heavy metal-associated domain-containing protein [Flavobacterium branchiarum]MDN3672892.1 heavy metal-associated domain-containing protein [Flavobacterium branchiarum]
MKTTYIKFVATAVILLLTGAKSYSQITKAEIMATGLTCSMCSNAINKQLKSYTEVDSIGTDLNTNTFTVYFKKDNSLEPKVLKKAVEKAGFFVGSMVLTAKFHTPTIEDNTTLKMDDATYTFIDIKNPVAHQEAKYRVLDKGFVTSKEYKKLLKSYSKYPGYATENENDYYLKAL